MATFFVPTFVGATGFKSVGPGYPATTPPREFELGAKRARPEKMV